MKTIKVHGRSDINIFILVSFKMFLRLSGGVWLLLLAVMLAAEADAGVETGGGQCRGVGAHLTIASRRNASGHLLTSLRLVQETRLPAPPTTTLLDVRTATTRCKGVRTDTLDVTLEGPPPPASPGYEYFEGLGNYKVHVERLTWEQAKRTCENEDAHLLILNSDEEAEVIRQAVKPYAGISFFFLIGANDKDIEGQYRTIFGDTLAAAGYEKWYSGEPTNSNQQNCMSVNTLTMSFFDEPCTSTYPFICEYIT